MSELKMQIKEKVLNQSKVIKLTETDLIKCSNCGKALMNVINEKYSSDILYSVIIDCPFCGDSSFQYEVNGLFRTHPCQGVVPINIETNEKTNVITFKTQRIEK